MEKLGNARRKREAYQTLQLWYGDWGNSLRSELGYHPVRFGLTRLKPGTSAAKEMLESAPIPLPCIRRQQLNRPSDHPERSIMRRDKPLRRKLQERATGRQ